MTVRHRFFATLRMINTIFGATLRMTNTTKAPDTHISRADMNKI